MYLHGVVQFRAGLEGRSRFVKWALGEELPPFQAAVGAAIVDAERRTSQ